MYFSVSFGVGEGHYDWPLLLLDFASEPLYVMSLLHT